MIATSLCERCSQLPPPPPIFSLGPPPNILSLNIHCSSRLLLSSIQHKKVISSSSISLPIALGILIALLISTGTILFIKNRMIKRQRQRKYDDNSLSVKFTGHSHRTKFIPLLSDSCSSDQTICTPLSEYPCNTIGSFDIRHEYEQIDSSHYYCLMYCRQCGSYHQTSPSSCGCHFRDFTH